MRLKLLIILNKALKLVNRGLKVVIRQKRTSPPGKDL